MDISLINLWEGFRYTTALEVFVAYLLVDAMYASYTLAVTRKQPAVSASIGASMHFFIAFGVLSYVQNLLYIFPLALGSWLGTYLVVKKEQGRGL